MGEREALQFNKIESPQRYTKRLQEIKFNTTVLISAPLLSLNQPTRRYPPDDIKSYRFFFESF